jgi:hypothetical protein
MYSARLGGIVSVHCFDLHRTTIGRTTGRAGPSCPMNGSVHQMLLLANQQLLERARVHPEVLEFMITRPVWVVRVFIMFTTLSMRLLQLGEDELSASAEGTRPPLNANWVPAKDRMSAADTLRTYP